MVVAGAKVGSEFKWLERWADYVPISAENCRFNEPAHNPLDFCNSHGSYATGLGKVQRTAS